MVVEDHPYKCESCKKEVFIAVPPEIGTHKIPCPNCSAEIQIKIQRNPG